MGHCPRPCHKPEMAPPTIVVAKPTQPLVFHIVAVAIACSFGVVPASLNASIFSDFAARIRSAILPAPKDVEEATPTMSTMNIMKPVVVDEELTQSALVDASSSQDALQVTTGALRVSTEDIDFPLNDEINVYEVKKGDTLSVIASKYKVSKNTIIWANDLKSEKLTPGTTLIILPMTGIKHTIKKGDTVASLAKKYKADVDDIAKFNGIAKDAELAVGDVVLVPDGEIATAAPRVTSTPSRSYIKTAPAGFFVRPLVGGRKTQGIHGNNGVDIAAPQGTSIVAAATGRVISARIGGYNGGYGNMVIISHDNGIQTIYAHMRDVYAVTGQTVTQGQVIGTVGNTGRSTGPHLHFEIRGAVNPF